MSVNENVSHSFARKYISELAVLATIGIRDGVVQGTKLG